jgi:hypothetical protein
MTETANNKKGNSWRPSGKRYGRTFFYTGKTGTNKKGDNNGRKEEYPGFSENEERG